MSIKISPGFWSQFEFYPLKRICWVFVCTTGVVEISKRPTSAKITVGGCVLDDLSSDIEVTTMGFDEYLLMFQCVGMMPVTVNDSDDFSEIREKILAMPVVLLMDGDHEYCVEEFDTTVGSMHILDMNEHSIEMLPYHTHANSKKCDFKQ